MRESVCERESVRAWVWRCWLLPRLVVPGLAESARRQRSEDDESFFCWLVGTGWLISRSVGLVVRVFAAVCFFLFLFFSSFFSPTRSSCFLVGLRACVWCVACFQGYDDSEKAWNAVCNVMKQGLMSPWPIENLGALELIGTVVDAIPGMEIEIPWGSWEARLVLGSIVKSLVEKSASPHVRVKELAALTLSRVADSHSVGLSLVS